MERALRSQPPRGYAAVPAGVRLLSIDRASDGAIVMDFSGELLAGGTGRVLEDSLHQIFTAASAARTPAAGRTPSPREGFGAPGADDYRVLVNGIGLEAHLR